MDRNVKAWRGGMEKVDVSLLTSSLKNSMTITEMGSNQGSLGQWLWKRTMSSCVSAKAYASDIDGIEGVIISSLEPGVFSVSAILRQSIGISHHYDRFRFDYFLRSCSADALGKRCEALMKAAEKEDAEWHKRCAVLDEEEGGKHEAALS